MRYRVLREDTLRVGDDGVLALTPERTDLTTALGSLLAGSDPGVSRKLSSFGIAYVYAPPRVSAAVAGAFDAAEGFTGASATAPDSRAWRFEGPATLTSVDGSVEAAAPARPRGPAGRRAGDCRARPSRQETPMSLPQPIAGRTRSWPALLAVLVTAGALVLAGQAGLPAQVAPGAGAPQQVGRTLVCPGGLPGASMQSGRSALDASRGGRVASSPLPGSDDQAKEVVVPPEQADGVFASQVARTGRWLALATCPEARADWWFVGVGASQAHSSTLQIVNPREGDAVIDLDVYGPKGLVEAPGLRGLFVPAGTTRTFDLAAVAPAVGDLAVHVTTSRGLVAVVASDSFAPDLVGTPVREWVAPQPAASRNLLLTGLPDKPSQATLLVANPGDVEALAQVEVVGAKGTFKPPENDTVAVPPGAVLAVPVTKVFDGQPLALRISSARQITATVRSVVAGDEAYAGAAGPVADGSALGVPDAVKAELRVSATGSAGVVQVLSFGPDGKRLDARRVSVKEAATVGHPLPKGTRHVVLRSAAAGLVAGLVVTADAGPGGGSGKGVGSAVFEAAARAARTPEVRRY